MGLLQLISYKKRLYVHRSLLYWLQLNMLNLQSQSWSPYHIVFSILFPLYFFAPSPLFSYFSRIAVTSSASPSLESKFFIYISFDLCCFTNLNWYFASTSLCPMTLVVSGLPWNVIRSLMHWQTLNIVFDCYFCTVESLNKPVSYKKNKNTPSADSSPSHSILGAEKNRK